MGAKKQSLLPELPCMCASLRRAARAATRLYDQELRETGLELSQFTLLMTLDIAGKVTQKTLGKILAMDSTTLTRTLSFLLERGWIAANPGEDRREKLIELTPAGRRQFELAQPYWERAQKKFKSGAGKKTWQELGPLLGRITAAAEIN